MKVLFLGDIVGQPGRRILKNQLQNIRKEHEIDVCVANAENAAAGFGISNTIANDLFSSGVDLMTMGNHTFARSDAFRFIESEPRMVRPANLMPPWPGFDYALFDGAEKGRLLVLNLLGRVNMSPCESPFYAADCLLSDLKAEFDVKMTLLDFHAETSSEKVAMGFYLDGRVSLCLGTHTHVRTADERILERGTGVITDVGMTGPRDGILGMEKDVSLRRLVFQLPAQYVVEGGIAMINGIKAELDSASGRCLSIERIYYCEEES